MKSCKHFLTHPRYSRGDTIVEVMISIAIVALVLATAFALSSNSLRTGIDASQRNQALALAQSQVEFIKNAISNNDPALSSYKDSTGICILPDRTATSADQPQCTNYSQQPYAIKVVFNSSTLVFTVTAQWDVQGSRKNELVLYYKLPSIFSFSSFLASMAVATGRQG